MQLDVHKRLYPLYITKKCPTLQQQSQKMHFVSSNACFSLMLLLTPLTAVLRNFIRLRSPLPSTAAFSFTLLLMHGRYDD